jgi:Glucose / Sorbosone dehydrogenase
MQRLRLTMILTLALLLLGAGAARGASLEPLGSFDEPIFVTSDPGNPERLFVVERAGKVVEVEHGLRSIFADLTALVGCAEDCVGERGLLSIALAPDFPISGRYYAYYGESPEPGDIHIVELTAIGRQTPLGSLRDVLTIPHPGHANHYGGQLQFGPEGNLFAGTGDGGGSDDVEHNAQDLDSALGKILRLGPRPSGALQYTPPPGNPFAGATYPRNLVWSYGLRNPYRFSFDRQGGDLMIGDVGQDASEEVDRAAAPGLGVGANYGWNCREGFDLGPATDEGCNAPGANFVPPVFAYPHRDPGNGGPWGCAIIGGYVARGPGLGDVAGRYLYGDLCSGQVRSFCPATPAATDRSEGVRVGGLNSFGEDSLGRVYAVSGAGPVFRLAGTGDASCTDPEPPPPPLAASFVGIRALRAQVRRHRRGQINVWVAPCRDSRRGDPVTLWRGWRQMGTRRLDRVCSVRFRPRIDRLTRFRATIEADATSQAAMSRRLTIRIARRKPAQRRRAKASSASLPAPRWR